MDTNHVAAWEAQHPTLVTKLQTLPKNTLIYTSAITLGEMAAGHEMTSGDPKRRHEVNTFLALYCIPDSLSVSHYTRSYYGQIVGRIWKKHAPPRASVSTDAHLVQLGVNVNDAWIVASAWEHGLTLLTSDSMTVIRSVTPEVAFENWLV